MTSPLDIYLFPLVANGACPAGTFELELETGRMVWSNGLYEIHSFSRGQIVPTLDLMMAHQHPDDREPFQRLLKKLADNGGQVALLHRIIDSRGRQRQAFSSIHQGPARDGAATATGFIVDLTHSMHEETRQAAEDAVRGAFAHKVIIEQAKGIVMTALSVNADAAFAVLAHESQRSNTKLHTLAARLVEAASRGTATELVRSWAAVAPERCPRP